MSTAVWAKIQAFVGVAPDGIPGNTTAVAVASKLGIDKAEPGPTLSDLVTIDVRSAANIATLRPDAQQKAREWLLKCLARVSYYEAAALDFAGIRIKRHYKVGGGFNFIFEFIS